MRDIAQDAEDVELHGGVLPLLYRVQDGDTARGLSPSSGISTAQLQSPYGSGRNAAILGSTCRIALSDSGMLDSDDEE